MVFDRSFSMPKTFMRHPTQHKWYWREAINGHAEFLDENAYDKFFGIGAKRHKPFLTLKQRLKVLVAEQELILSCLRDILDFPFVLRFIDSWCGLLMFPEHNYHARREEAFKQAYWFLTCIVCFSLIHFFGGSLIADKQHGLTVKLERARLNIHVYEKLYGKESGNFQEWYYQLCTVLWRHFNEGRLITLDGLDCISIREEF
jgi:hypothetical protein